MKQLHDTKAKRTSARTAREIKRLIGEYRRIEQRTLSEIKYHDIEYGSSFASRIAA